MTDDTKHGARLSLRRWSERKHAEARDASPTKSPARPDLVATSSTAAPVRASTATPIAERSTPTLTPPNEAAAAAVALPPVESLTLDSDFTAFMQPSVDPSLRHAALRKLFNDPRFNVMDGLDVYIDDYSKSTPIEPEVLQQLVAARNILFPVETRVNAQGYVEDVPHETPAAEAGTDVAIDAAVDVAADAPAQFELPLAAPTSRTG